MVTQYGKRYLTTSEAVDLSGYGYSKLFHKMHEGKLPYIQEIKGRHRVLIDERELLKHMAKHQSKSNPFGEVKVSHKVALYPIYGYDYAYAVSSDQRIFNLTDGKELIQTLDVDHMVVTLIRGGEKVKVEVHRLIGQTQCNNVLNRQIWHHINNNSTDNRPSNLIALENNSVHRKLHALLKKSKKEYREAIKTIQAENKQTLYKILDEEMSNDLCQSYFLVKREGYNHYKETGEILPDQVVQQYVELKEG